MAQADGLSTNDKHLVPYRPKPLTTLPNGDEILLAVAKTNKGKFSWWVYKKTKGVRHTGIVIQIGDRSFTIDYGVQSGGKVTVSRLVWGDTVDGVVKFKEQVGGELLFKGDPIQSFDLCEDIGQGRALAVANALLKEETTPYNLKDFNCRHHVQRCIDRVEDVSNNKNIPIDVGLDLVRSQVRRLFYSE